MIHTQARIQTGRNRHLCVSLATGNYFVPMVERTDGMFRVAIPFADVASVQRKPKARLSLSAMDWTVDRVKWDRRWSW